MKVLAEEKNRRKTTGHGNEHGSVLTLKHRKQSKQTPGVPAKGTVPG